MSQPKLSGSYPYFKFDGRLYRIHPGSVRANNVLVRVSRGKYLRADQLDPPKLLSWRQWLPLLITRRKAVEQAQPVATVQVEFSGYLRHLPSGRYWALNAPTPADCAMLSAKTASRFMLELQQINGTVRIWQLTCFVRTGAVSSLAYLALQPLGSDEVTFHYDARGMLKRITIRRPA